MSGEMEIDYPTRPKVIARSSCGHRVRLAICLHRSEAMPCLLGNRMDKERSGMMVTPINPFSVADGMICTNALYSSLIYLSKVFYLE